MPYNVPSICTRLWDHQKSASDVITHGMTVFGKRGYGDASSVGSGKTLCSLAVMTNLLEFNTNVHDAQYTGFLVLLPKISLLKTWTDEIIKHIIGFNICTQEANGKLSRNIDANTIVLTTLGRCRDHPIAHSWIMVVLDECLSVQNKDALQTQEAWRQIMCSQYGVMMLSATFFRSRFDQLFYMLKMLRTGLPEEKKYLDAILSESIICHIPEKSRKWITNTNKYDLTTDHRVAYNKIMYQDINSEMLYNRLAKYIYDNVDYIKYFKATLKKLYKSNKALIYAKSKEEADNIATQITDVSRFPDTSKKHIVGSYSECSHGVNILTYCNCIVTRVRTLDKIIQVKGRLDRPTQVHSVLRLEYILIKDTIEEAWLFQLELGKQFYSEYVLPLSVIYKLATNKITEKEILNSLNNTT